MKDTRFLAEISGIALILGLFLTGCPEESSSGSNPKIVNVYVAGPQTVYQGKMYNYAASVISEPEDAQSSGVYWSVTGQTEGTTIDHITGVLMIDSAESNGTQLKITATSRTDNTQSGSLTATVGISDYIGISPSVVTNATPGGTVQFTFTSTKEQKANWTVSSLPNRNAPLPGTGFEVNGHIIQTTYNPSTFSLLHIDIDEPEGEFEITAETQSGNKAYATVRIGPKPAVTGITIIPNHPAYYIADRATTIRFTAAVDGDAGINREVTWWASGGSITPNGVLTIPANMHSTLTVVATASSANALQPSGIPCTASVDVIPMVPVGNIVCNFPDVFVGQELPLPSDNEILYDFAVNAQTGMSGSGYPAPLKTVIWSIEYPSTIYADINGNTAGNQKLHGLSQGTAILTATIENGLGPGSNYTQTFSVTVRPVTAGIEISWDTNAPTSQLDGNTIQLVDSDTTVSVTPPTGSSTVFVYYDWLVDGVSVFAGPASQGYSTAPIGNLDRFPTGLHYLTVIAYTSEGKPYSKDTTYRK
ncbi:MAG: hypothetical protein LBG87_01665 [Spirochaetaceae bacterium]|jgi:hypothetical protein|nr:hypothetical protein [Spirochaetaceae bacterium]